MKSPGFAVFLVAVGVLNIGYGQECNEILLRRLIEALSKSVSYIAKNKEQMNLDGIVSMNMLADQYEVLSRRIDLQKMPLDLRDTIYNSVLMANDTIIKYRSIFQVLEPDRFEGLHPVLDEKTWSIDYSLRFVNQSLIEKPLTCEQIQFSWEVSDHCLSEFLHYNINRTISLACWDRMTRYGFKDYPLSHELLYLIFAETRGYLKTLSKPKWKKVEFLQNYFCANMYRDAKELTELDFPASMRDLFLEQNALCMMYGFVDFFRPDWLEATLSWIQPNGCCISPPTPTCTDDKSELTKSRRKKREDVTLSDGCSAHMTSMSVMAMAMQVRFCLEIMHNNNTNIYHGKKKSQ